MAAESAEAVEADKVMDEAKRATAAAEIAGTV
jgi:hypothetical protein